MIPRSIMANPALAWLETPGWWEFLRREMAPTPERWGATVRLTLACVICTIPMMMFHLKQPAVMIIAIFLVSRQDLSGTLLGTIMAIVAATFGWGLLVLYYVCALDLTWLRVLCVPAFIGLGLLMMRVVNPSILGLSVAIYVGFGLTIPDTVSNIETLNRTPTYYWWAWTLGVSANLAVQYLLNPHTSHSLLVRGLLSRLKAVEASLRALAAGELVQSQRSSIAELAFSGAAEQLRILKLLGAVDSLLNKHKSEFTAQIILVDRLVTAASLLDNRAISPISDALKARLLRAAEVCAAWRLALQQAHPLKFQALPGASAPNTAKTEALPALAEIERVIELLPLAASGKNLPDELKLPTHQKTGFLAPDAFTNPEHLHYALKGMLAATFCYLAFTLFAYPGIYTCVITCVVCSLSTVGASAQKGILRFAGAAVGAALGFISLMYVFPHLDSLVGFWFPFGAAMGLAAYVNFGSARISYVGVQMGFAFSKCAFQSYGTYTELRVARDRMIGIAFGLLVFGFINSRLWPVRALQTLRAKLSDVCHQLALLANPPQEGENRALQTAEAYNLRLKIYEDFSVVGEMLESSKFEGGAETRRKLAAFSDDAKVLFLRLLCISQNPSDADGLPKSLRTEVARFRAKMADAARMLAEALEGKPSRHAPDLGAALSELEQIVAAEIETVRDPRVAGEIRAHLALYRETIPIAKQLFETIGA